MAKKGDFVVDANKQVSMVIRVDKRVTVKGEKQDLSRYTLQYADGSRLSNAPGYSLRKATEKEVVAALQAQRKAALALIRAG